jgi:UDP-GlcNAc:undecaprenyl-phosphate GlcNAc-1-phosphate transferase
MNIDGYMVGIPYFTVVLIILFFLGIKDDLLVLDPKKKLIAEILGAVILTAFTDIHFTNFHGFLGVHAIPMWLSYLTTIILVVVILNSVNLIDGIDGLAGSISIIASVTLGAWFWLSGETGFTIMASALTGALLVFLCFNLSNGKYKIFMGDSGSLLIGFIIAVMIIKFNEINAGSGVIYNLDSSPAITIAILIVPLFDTLRVFTIRIWRRQNPFKGDNRHIHHMLLKARYSHRQSTLFLSIAQITIIGVAFLLDHIGILWLSLVLFLICIALTGLVYLLIYRQSLAKNVYKDIEDPSEKVNLAHIRQMIGMVSIENEADDDPEKDKNGQNYQEDEIVNF